MKNWVVLAENYPLMPLPEHFDRKDHLEEAVYQFGHLYKQEEEWDSSRGLIRGAGGGREVKSNNQNERIRNKERSDAS